MTDGVNHNYNGQEISSAALNTILKRQKLALASEGGKEANVNSGHLSGMVFVSERQEGLELLHIALRFNDIYNPYPPKPKVKVFCLADVFGKVNFSGVRMEDSGCIAGDNLVYVTNKDPAPDRRQPWTAVYKTNLKTGKTDRLTPLVQADLSPSVAPSGMKIAMASFERKHGGWNCEIEDLQTNIFVTNIEEPFNRKLVVRNGGWPTWGSDNVIFFHRKNREFWGVFCTDLNSGIESRVTPDGIQAITPAAIDRVAVATIRQNSKLSDVVRVETQFRHIEIFDSTGQQQNIRITQNTMPRADHFNPFVIDGGKRISYHRCKSSKEDIQRNSHKLESPHPDVGLFRVPGIFPTFSKDGSKLAFVDNEFKAVWVADSEGLRILFETKGPDNIFSPVWNQSPDKHILYVNTGPPFKSDKTVNICAILNVSSGAQRRVQLTKGFNNAFPSTNPDGTKLVFRSTRDGGNKRYKNLYIMENAQSGEYGGGEITRLTNGPWTDTHCQWSIRGDWIVFSSTRDKPEGAPESDNDLDPGYFAVFLVKANDPSMVVRSRWKRIVVTADLAAVPVDPISLPLFLHSVRPYGDIFTVDIDSDNLYKNKNVKFNRITHSRYENSTGTWTMFSTQDPNAAWNMLLDKAFTPSCPYAHRDGGEKWHMNGYLSIPKKC
ncbi:unnamed protein product [Camellia sinensis]